MNEKQKAAVVLEYWIRTLLSGQNVLHMVKIIMMVISQYFCFDKLLWSNHGKGRFWMSKDEQMITKTCFEIGYGSLHSKRVYSGNTLSTINWELTLIKKTKKALCGRSLHILVMGYIDAKCIGEFRDDGIITQENSHEAALFVQEGGRGCRIHTQYDLAQKLGDWEIANKPRDRYRLYFDFPSKSCTAFFNDKLLGPLSTNIPNEIYLGISVYAAGDTWETTLFETVSRISSNECTD